MDKNTWNNAVQAAVGNLGICGKLLETVDKNVYKEFIKKFENCVDEYSSLDMIHKSTLEALEETKEYFVNEENDMDIPPKKIFEQNFKEKPKPTEESIKTHKLQDIFIGEIRGENMDNEENDNYDDIISTNQFVPPTDPISKEPIKNPVKNKKCGHIYDKDTITKMLSHRNMRCPYIGCPSKQPIQLNLLETDHELKRKIDRHYLNV